jgi:uncharacterized protein (UPF0297 family)
MEKEQIKLAFSRVKQDISNLKNEFFTIKREITEIKELLSSLHSELNNKILNKIAQNNSYFISTDTPTLQHSNPTINRYPTDTPTLPMEIEGLKDQNIELSIGNEGVPTDRQTDRQTDQQTQKSPFLEQKSLSTIESNILEASEILNSLDRLKKEIRLKFKQLTSQEMLVFSTIYQLEEKDPKDTTYNKIALILNLSESSIRDYTLKMIRKGIPIKKQKINNRTVLLSISSELKKIATLPIIIRLREL